MPRRIGPKKPRRVYLRLWREYHDLTQEQVAGRLGEGVNKGTVSRWETGERRANLEAYAEAIGVPVERLYEVPPPKEAKPAPKSVVGLPSDFKQMIADAVAEALRQQRSRR